MRRGDHVARIAAFPATDGQAGHTDWRLDPHADENGFRDATMAFFGEQDVMFELSARLWTGAGSRTIEDAPVEWKEAETPFRTIATIHLSRPGRPTGPRVRYFD